MRLTRAGEYAIRCMLYIFSKEKGAIVKRLEIAEEMDIPDQFLGKVAQQLARSGILEIIQGAKGGYRVLKPPEKLTMLDVVEAVTGQISLNDCVLRTDSCAKSSICQVHFVWVKATNQLRDTLNNATFAKLMKSEACLITSK